MKGLYCISVGSINIPEYRRLTGSRSTFEFPSRVNLSSPCLYCTNSMDRNSQCYKVDLVRLYASYAEFTFTKEAKVRGLLIGCVLQVYIQFVEILHILAFNRIPCTLLLDVYSRCTYNCRNIAYSSL